MTLLDVEWHRGNDVRFVDVTVQPLTGATDEPAGVTVSFADVTRYRRLQQELQDAKRKLATTAEDLQTRVEELEAAKEELRSLHRAADAPRHPEPELEHSSLDFPHGAIGIRADLRVAFANARARQILGAGVIRVGRRLADGGAEGKVRELAERLVREATPLPATIVELADGRALRVTGAAGRGERTGLLLLEDVTRERRHEHVMHEFVQNAAHQLRTPLTGIASAIEVLESGAKNLPRERDRFLAHARAHADRLTGITRGLLMLARAQSGEIMRLDLVELRPLLDDLAAGAQPVAGVRIQVECAPGVAALGEPGLLQEAVAALVDNAVEHTREGEIRLSAREVDGDVLVEVADTGDGILPEHRPRLFEPFSRFSAAGDGFGLGLAIAAQAVKAMDGELRVADAAEGARVAIRLPSARMAP